MTPSWITVLKGRRSIIGRRSRPQVEFSGFQELGQDLSQSLPWGKIANVRKWKDPSAQPFLFNMIHPHSWRVLTLVSRKQTAVSLSDSSLPRSALEPTPLKSFRAKDGFISKLCRLYMVIYLVLAPPFESIEREGALERHSIISDKKDCNFVAYQVLIRFTRTRALQIMESCNAGLENMEKVWRTWKTRKTWKRWKT